MMKLTCEFIPAPLIGMNVRTVTDADLWDEIRKYVYWLNDNLCQVCGSGGETHCHEKFKYFEKGDRKIQKLIAFECLCVKCHEAKHLNQLIENPKKRSGFVISRLGTVNELTGAQTKAYVTKCLKILAYRSKFSWEQDFSYLDKFVTEELP